MRKNNKEKKKKNFTDEKNFKNCKKIKHVKTLFLIGLILATSALEHEQKPPFRYSTTPSF